MPTHIERIALVVLCFISIGCSAANRHQMDRSRSLFPGLASQPVDNLQALYARRVVLPRSPRVALFWFDEPSTLPDAERTRLLQDLQRGISHPPLSVISAAPTTRMVSFSESTVDLDALRSSAARFQSDLLVLILTRTDAFNDWNLLSMSYVALVPAFFIPGNDLATYVTAEACAVDVRTGVFLGCAQGHGDAARSFVTPLGTDARQRELVTAATEAALRSLPQQLSDIVVARLDPSGDTYPTE